MKTQEITLEKNDSRQRNNTALAIYIAFVTTFVLSYSVITAIQNL